MLQVCLVQQAVGVAVSQPQGKLEVDAAPLAARAINYFFHIHKCGGSSMCQLADANGERVDRGKNCNTEQLGFGCSEADGARGSQVIAQSADVQLADLRAQGLTFVANECGAPHALLNKTSVMYAVALREPLERAASHFYFDARFDYHDFGTTVFNDYVLNVLNTSAADDYAKFYWQVGGMLSGRAVGWA